MNIGVNLVIYQNFLDLHFEFFKSVIRPPTSGRGDIMFTIKCLLFSQSEFSSVCPSQNKGIS